MSADDKLKELGLTLPDVPTPVATYVSFKRVGEFIYLSGQGPKRADGTYPTGKVRPSSLSLSSALMRFSHRLSNRGPDSGPHRHS